MMKKWDFLEAKHNYWDKKIKRNKRKKSCNNCEFFEDGWARPNYCKVKETEITFDMFNAIICKYYTKKEG